MAKYYCRNFPTCRWTGRECNVGDPAALEGQREHILGCEHTAPELKIPCPWAYCTAAPLDPCHRPTPRHLFGDPRFSKGRDLPPGRFHKRRTLAARDKEADRRV